ncbi:NUDIX domain-containing protein [Halobacillus sp. A5]|uniref:NUDIX domain-containing protein n=1 Tax=Halobacillus sp. A5 TaxID=2880263 RepID=UPI0020A66B92|nr:NUDIX hydrolase [Halobacillus sp. A5]MCP3025784.1 NUDIX hydrolase [Halobacillus sp. A5]
MRKFEEVTTETREIFKGKIIHLNVDTVTLPDGNTSKREIIKHPGAVAVIAQKEDGKIIFVEQYRKALEKSLVEIPAGKLEAGEDPIVTAKRELEEETGYTTNQLELINSFYTSPGFADELVNVYFTSQLIPLEEKVAGDDDEFVELLELTLGEAEKLEKEQRIHDAKTSYALLYLKLRGLK